MQVLLEGDLLRGVRQRQAGQPAQMRCRPGALARVHHAIAQQQCLQAVACVALLAHGVLTGAHQVAQRLVHGVGHAHGTEFARARQARKHQRIAPIGLHPVARALGDR